MLGLLKKPARMAGAILAAGLLVAAPGAFAQSPAQPYAAQRAAGTQKRMAQPGTVNYIEGQVTLNGQSVSQNDVGSVVVAPGQVLQTANGKVEMLLTPGVFFRLGPQSAAKMVSPSLSDTRVELVQGHGMMEAAEFLKENHIQVTVGPAATTIEARGIYEFTSNPAMARVYDGKASVELNERTKGISKGDEIALDAGNAKLKTRDFDLKRTETSDDLYAWSKLRADYTAQANMSAAESYAGYGPGYYGAGWYGSGWYWNPYFSQYAFLLNDGFLWDPFGFGFFSPGYWGFYGSYLGYGYGYGAWGHGALGRGYPGGAITRSSAAGAAIGRGGIGGFRGGAVGGFRGGAFQGGFHGGGFGGGGFHGGGGFGGGGRR